MIGSHGTPSPASVDHAGHLPRPQVPAALRLVDVISHPAHQAIESVCPDCHMRKLSICAALQGAELVAMRNIARHVRYSRTAAIFEQDDLAASVDIVTEGVVRLYKTLPDGRWQIVRFALPGDCLGLAIDGCYELSATAVSDVSICRFSSRAFGEFLKAQPHLLRRLHEGVEQELSSAQDHMVLLSRFSAKRKLAAFLIEMSNRWRRMNGVSAHVPLPMSRRDIAAYLGMTYETTSRMMSLLVRQKLVAIVPDGISIRDRGRLIRVAGE